VTRSMNAVTEISHMTRTENAVTEIFHVMRPKNTVSKISQVMGPKNAAIEISHLTRPENAVIEICHATRPENAMTEISYANLDGASGRTAVPLGNMIRVIYSCSFLHYDINLLFIANFLDYNEMINQTGLTCVIGGFIFIIVFLSTAVCTDKRFCK